jgi:sugar phosphate isomerase/epimerase
MMNSIPRRRFLQNAGLGLTALALGRQRQLLANPYGMPIGLQLYTVRDHMEKDVEGTIKRVAEIGYREVELGDPNYYGEKPAELRRILTDQGLKAISTHLDESQLKSDLEKHIAEAKECGVSYIGLSSLDEHDRESLEAVKRDAEWFNQIGKSVSGAGCRFFYHGHNFDYANVGGAVIYDELIRRTDPKFVNFELDCFWCVRAGKDPVDYFQRFPGRFPQLHIKDLKPGYPPTTGEDFRPGAFTEVGQGVIDWKKIFKAARAGGMKHFYVEQDECDRDSLESAKISYTYLHNLTV